MGSHVGLWTVQCAPREHLVHGLDWTLHWRDSKLKFHSQCAAGLRQAQRSGAGERNVQERVLCRHAQLMTVGQRSTHCRLCGEQEDAFQRLTLGPSGF